MATKPSIKPQLLLLSQIWFAIAFVFPITAIFASAKVISAVLPAFIFIIYGLSLLTLAALIRLALDHVQRAEKNQATLELLRLQLLDTVPRPSPANPTPSANPSPTTSPKDDRPDNDPSRAQVLELLKQIRDVAMMNDSQLEHVAARHWAKRKEHLRHLVERHMLSGDWPTAKTRLDELTALLPEDADVKQLAERVSEEHALRLDEDLKAARSQIKQLSKINAWQEAEEVVSGLDRKYPDDHEVKALAEEVLHDKEEAERETRERLLADVTAATAKHDWPHAITAVEEFLHRFPSDKLSDRLRVDLLTLRENAAAHERKEQEALFKDLLKQHEYEKADTLAKSLIAKFPGSSTALELAKLLPKVEELIHQEKLKRQSPPPAPPSNPN